MTNYKLSATYLDGTTRCFADRAYAMGDNADKVWDNENDAWNAAAWLRKDVGTIVDESIEYEVIETDESCSP